MLHLCLDNFPQSLKDLYALPWVNQKIDLKG